MPDDWDVWMSGCRIIQDGRFLRRSPVQPSAQSRVGYGQTRLLRALSSRNPKGSQRHGLSWQFTPLPYSPLGGKVFPCTWSSLVYPCCLLSSLCAIEQPGSVTLMTSLLVGPSSEGRTCPVPTASPHWASALAPSQCLTDELAAVYWCPYWGFKARCRIVRMINKQWAEVIIASLALLALVLSMTLDAVGLSLVPGHAAGSCAACCLRSNQSPGTFQQSCSSARQLVEAWAHFHGEDKKK